MLQRVLLLLGTGRDTKLTSELLDRNGIACLACQGVEQLRTEIDHGVGAVLIAEEHLAEGGQDALRRVLEAQPAWSDLPILVLARPGADSATVGEALALLGNVSLLERPLRVAALVSVVRTALRARSRQYQIQANLETLERSRDAEALAVRRKDEFLAMLAHELRNPLAPIRTALYLLEQNDADPDRRHSLRATMQRQVDHLMRLVDDLLETSRISRGMIQLQRTQMDLKEALLRAAELSRPQLDSAGCTLEMHFDPLPIPIDADQIRIAQVFGNLLNNAARYGRPGGVVHLHAERTPEGALARVVDDGIGIDAEVLPHVFELFTQGPHAADTPRGGLGIGLALVRMLVEQHGGQVEAASEGLGKGAEFRVRLPLSTEARAGPVAQDPVRRVIAKGLRLLVVDDNQDAVETLSMLLSTLGVEHRTANDGPGALALAERFRPRMVLLDIGMPGMDGYEVARRLRSQSRHEGVVLVALTGWGGEQDHERSQAAGFDHHLRKPADVNELLRLIATVELEANSQ
jgi:signal transduction histidine kinase/ActR/RegA family two-component response regulator